jgi:hypothetical protein
MKTRDRILELFEEDVASALLEFGKSLSKIDADIVVFLARKSLCLYDVLLAAGIPPINKCAVSDRTLDLGLDMFRGRRVALIDDTLIVGTSVARAKRRLEVEAGAIVQTHVFCIDTDWHCPDLIVPDSVTMSLPDDRVMTFCTAEVRALSILPRPYLVDFPLTRTIRLSAEESQCMLSSTNWYGTRLSTPLQEKHGVSIITFFPTDAIIAEIAAQVGPTLFSFIELIKVRAFARKSGSSYTVRFVPIVTLKPLTIENLDRLFIQVLELTERAAGTDLSRLRHLAQMPLARQRCVQFILSAALGNLFHQSLNAAVGRSVPLRFDQNETDRHFGPWLHRETERISEAARFDGLAQNTVEKKAGRIVVAALPEKVIDWSAETIGTDAARRRFRTKQPRTGQISLLADFAEIFRRIYQRRELPARQEARELGRRLLDSDQKTPRRDRLEMGVPWKVLVNWMAGLHEARPSLKVANIFSLLLDLCNDLGIAVPVTCLQDGVVFRAYRHGEDVKFSDGELALAFEVAEGFLKGARRSKIPRLTLEKLLVLLIKVGAAQGFLEPLYGPSGAEGTCRIGFDLKGARALFSRGPKDRSERNIWLTEFLVGREVLREVSETRKQYALGRKPEGNFLVSRAPEQAYSLGWIIGILVGRLEKRGGGLNENELTLLATCATPQHAASAMQVELHIFLDWFEHEGIRTLRKLKWNDPETLRATVKAILTSRGHEAIHSAKMKFVGYRCKAVRAIIERCQEQLWVDNALAAKTWQSYWKALLKSDRNREIAAFDPLTDDAGALIWQAGVFLSAIEIAVRYEQAQLDPSFRGDLEHAFEKLRDFRRDLIESGLPEPQLARIIWARFQKMEILRQAEFAASEEGLILSEIGAKDAKASSFKSGTAVDYAIQQIRGLAPEIERIIDLVERLVERFGKAEDRTDYQYMVYYDIVDSTATKIGQTGIDVERYRAQVKEFKQHVNAQFDALSRVAVSNQSEVFCQNGNKTSTNDCKHVFFRGGRSLKYLHDVLRLLFEGAAYIGIRVRVHVVPCNFAGSSAYRQGFDPEVRGERFWEHWSRVSKHATVHEKEVDSEYSFLLVATPDLQKLIALPRNIDWQDTRETVVESEIELLSISTRVRFGSIRARGTSAPWP